MNQPSAERRAPSAGDTPVALYLTRNLLIGGAERVFVTYVNNAHSVKPVVALLERKGGLLGELSPGVSLLSRVDRTTAPSVAANLALEIPGETFVRLGLECRWLRRVIRQSGAVVTSSFLMRAHIVALMTKILLLPRMKVVLNIHEHMTESAPYFYPLTRDRAMVRWITRNLFPRADRIVVVAEELKRDLVSSYGVPAAMIDVAHNPFEIDHIRAEGTRPLGTEWAAPPGRRTIVAVGRLVHLKGYDLLLRAVAQLRRKRDVRLILIGDGDDREKLEQLSASLGLKEFVTFAGQRNSPWPFIAAAAVLAVTSRTEAFPSVLAEAMALGVPVLATDCSGGVRELLRDGACGLLVPMEDVDAIAGGLDRLLEDRELRASFIAAGHERIQPFNVPDAQRRYEKILTDVIAQRAT